MKRLVLLAATVLLTLGGIAQTATASEVEQITIQAANCQHSAGAGTVVSAAYVQSPSGYNHGAVQLCRSGSYYWGYIVLYEPQLSGWWATTHLFRYEDGVHKGTWNCDHSGGNGYVAAGQTMCWTPRIYDTGTSSKFAASGKDVVGTYPNGTQMAYGITGRA